MTIEHFSAERIANPYPFGDLPWQLYHSVRNAVVRCCRQFGSVGPMDECPITAGNEPRFGEWASLPGDAFDFWILDDQLNHERYVYAELSRPEHFTRAWLVHLMNTLSEFPGWGLGITSIRDGYILVFGDKLLVKGKMFDNCRNVDCIVRQVGACSS